MQRRQYSMHIYNVCEPMLGIDTAQIETASIMKHIVDYMNVSQTVKNYIELKLESNKTDMPIDFSEAEIWRQIVATPNNRFFDERRYGIFMSPQTIFDHAIGRYASTYLLASMRTSEAFEWISTPLTLRRSIWFRISRFLFEDPRDRITIAFELSDHRPFRESTPIKTHVNDVDLVDRILTYEMVSTTPIQAARLQLGLLGLDPASFDLLAGLIVRGHEKTKYPEQKELNQIMGIVFRTRYYESL